MLQNILPHRNIAIRYNTSPVSVKIDTPCSHKDDRYPVTIGLTCVESTNGTPVTNVMALTLLLTITTKHSQVINGSHVDEHIHAKYVVGCDGAHSWLRKRLDVVLEGDMTDSVFGQSPSLEGSTSSLTTSPQA